MARIAIHRPSLSEVEYIAFSLAQELMHFGEPIPPFDTRYPDKLESCLMTPFQTYGGRGLYPTLVKKASMLFYLMIKNHPFQNGNKRVAVVTLYYFLRSNNLKLKVDNIVLYEFAREVAASDPAHKDDVLSKISGFITEFSEKFLRQQKSDDAKL